jgi:caa(3)-type oxidase subunit IV
MNAVGGVSGANDVSSEADRGLRRHLMVFVALVALTILELAVIELDVGRAARITALCGLAMAKAAALLLFFMQLWTESRALRLTAALPLVLAPGLTIVLMLDAIFRLGAAR